MIDLQPGDVFVVNSNSKLAPIINWCQKMKALDHEAIYNHAGLIINTRGDTIEALTTISHGNVYNYVGCDILIVRHILMTPELFKAACGEIEKMIGWWYPAPRLLLHLVGLAKFVHWKFPVCSEVVTKFEFEAGLRKNWWGWSPDNLADLWLVSVNYVIKYCQVLQYERSK